MKKTSDLLKKVLKEVDLVWEIRDARIPQASGNPLLSSLIGSKPRLIFFNKKDLADPVVTAEWKHWYASQNLPSPLAISAKTGENLSELLSLSARWGEGRIRGRNRPLRCLVVGIPNVGKSMLINTLGKRRRAQIENRPGSTRQISRLTLSKSLQIYDTPGMLWPRISDQTVGHLLLAVGAIRDEIFPLLDVSQEVARILLTRYPGFLEIKCPGSPSLPKTPLELIVSVAQRQGLLQKGGKPDIERGAFRLLQDLRKGRLGRVSLERPR